MAYYKVTGIKWDTDGAKVKLPKESIAICDSKEEVVDNLSDNYGFCIESVEEIREIELTNYEVDTEYKSGRKRTEIICAETEAEMWKIYDASHNKKKVESSAIVDSWPM